MSRLMAAYLAPLLLLPAAASARTSAQGNTTLDRLRAGAAGRIEVLRTPDGARVRRIAGRLTSPRSAPAEEIARTFLIDNGEMFGLRADLADLKPRTTRSSPGGQHVSFDQEIEGLPVFDGGLDLHVGRDGVVYLVESRYA